MSDVYVNPLTSRYASSKMAQLFSPIKRIEIWRHLWLALAEGEKELGLSISEQQINELKANLNCIDLEKINSFEKDTQHDVMANILAYGEICPNAKKIIHLGATSTFVTDNGDLIIIKQAFEFIIEKMKTLMQLLKEFCLAYAETACLGYTHYQPAQVTTIGKRATLWLSDFLHDYLNWIDISINLPFLGAKGATGTQASFLHLFQNDSNKVFKLDTFLAQKFGFKKTFSVVGQTYPRKQDTFIIFSLATFAASAHKLATDLRLLCHDKEIVEFFDSKKQVGSSAMPYKQNPIYLERVCSIARYLISLNENPLYTLATQWLERTLDDSANRRIVIAQAFLSVDALLELLMQLIPKLRVNKEIVANNLMKNYSNMVMENILMASTLKGGDRQILHEKLRQYSSTLDPKDKDSFLNRICEDKDFALVKEELKELSNIQNLTGLSASQVYNFIQNDIDPILT